MILKKDDRDEIYQIYIKIYKSIFSEERFNLADFYVWLVENQCIHISLLVKKMVRIYKINSPFEQDYYVLDILAYLYNHNLIAEIPLLKESKKIRSKVTNRPLSKNEYRLQYYTKKRN
jgi:hypothetical protein